MTERRVVVTGMSGITSLGNSYSDIKGKLINKKNGVRYMGEWEDITGLNTKLAAPIDDFKLPAKYTRKMTRSMGKVAQMATLAGEQALIHAGLVTESAVTDGRMGIAFGSCTGSPDAVKDFSNLLSHRNTTGITANTYLKMMAHTCAVNMAVHFGFKGRVIPVTSACTSGSQSIGYGYESIKYGQQVLMLCGGAEELCPSEAAVFDALFATSTKNKSPEITPAPFDKDRDGLVLGEGAGVLILEEMQHAIQRGATIHAELVGFGTNCDAQHITNPSSDTMAVAMSKALASARLTPSHISYINGHGTGTDRGDIAESEATRQVFGGRTPYSTLKSYFGHTLGACGAIESWLSLEMINEGWIAPNLNLINLDPLCAELDYITGEGRKLHADFAMVNNFAFGGINTSLIFKRWNQ